MTADEAERARARSARRRGPPASRATSASMRPTPPTRLPGQDDHRRRPATSRRKFIVRLEELFESYRVIREILDNLPPGDLTVQREAADPGRRDDQPRRGAARRAVLLPAGAPADRTPTACKVRTPSLCNWASVLAHGRRPQAGRRADADCRHRPLLLVQRPPGHHHAARRRRDLDLGAAPPIRNRVLPMNITAATARRPAPLPRRAVPAVRPAWSTNGPTASWSRGSRTASARAGSSRWPTW